MGIKFMLKKLFLILIFLSLNTSAYSNEKLEEVFINCNPCPALNGIMESEEQYYEEISKCHEHLMNHIDARELLFPGSIKEYKEKLRNIRLSHPGLSEFEYMNQINSAIASKIKAISFLAPVQQCIYPNFDFSKETLAAISFMVGGCYDPIVEKKLEIDSKNKIYKIKIDVTQQGSCEVGRMVSVAFKIPKVTGYHVEIEKNIQTNLDPKVND